MKNQLVDIRPIWFHYVVGKTIGIVSIVVMNPKCWQESAAHNGPSNDSPENSVSVIQKVVWRDSVTVAGEFVVGKWGENVFPIKDRRTSFKIVGISAFHVGSPFHHSADFNVGAYRQHFRLILNFCLNRLLPKLFFRGAEASIWLVKRSV